MTLLEGDGTVKERLPRPMAIARWPVERLPGGLGLSIKDGWNWGIGFRLAMAIAVPLILALIGCVLGIGIAILGGSLEALL